MVRLRHCPVLSDARDKRKDHGFYLFPEGIAAAMRLFSKLYIFLLLGIVTILVVQGNINYELEIRQIEHTMEQDSKEFGKAVAAVLSSVWQESGFERVQRLIDRSGPTGDDIAFTWFWPDEAADHLAAVAPGAAKLVTGDEPISYIATDDQRRKYRFTLVPVKITGERRGLVQVRQSLASFDRYSHRLLLRSLLVTAVLVLTSGILLYLFIYVNIHQPLEKLARKAVEIGRGNLAADLELKGNNELAGLGRSINDMCTRLLIAKEKIHFEYLARLKTLEQLRHTEKLSTIGQISAGIAHEMGTPLNVVDGRAKMIITEPLEREEIVTCAEIIRNQAEKMTQIIRQLLDFSRKKTSGPKTRENIEVIVSQVVRLLQPIGARQGTTLQVKTAPDSRLHCRMDAQQIQQVLMNVIINAIQASPPKGHVQIEITNTMLQSMIHTDDRPKEFIRIEILDEGAGIPEHHLPEIFTPFFTTKQIGLGTGLGLSVAQELLEKHGGWIEVQNRSLRGAHFSIFLQPEEHSS
jgi:two-component system, NtrC family, sensor kinase